MYFSSAPTSRAIELSFYPLTQSLTTLFTCEISRSVSFSFQTTFSMYLHSVSTNQRGFRVFFFFTRFTLHYSRVAVKNFHIERNISRRSFPVQRPMFIVFFFFLECSLYQMIACDAFQFHLRSHRACLIFSGSANINSSIHRPMPTRWRTPFASMRMVFVISLMANNGDRYAIHLMAMNAVMWHSVRHCVRSISIKLISLNDPTPNMGLIPQQ